MTKILTVDEMDANVELSRVHVVKQNAIIARLTEQGHNETADKARDILATMHEHLEFEIGMLERMRGEAKGRGQVT